MSPFYLREKKYILGEGPLAVGRGLPLLALGVLGAAGFFLSKGGGVESIWGFQ